MADEFAPGDLALCIDAGPSDEGYTPPELEEGKVYTVYAVGLDSAGELGVFLDEIDSAGYAGGYLAYRFRKLPLIIDDRAAPRVEMIPA